MNGIIVEPVYKYNVSGLGSKLKKTVSKVSSAVVNTVQSVQSVANTVQSQVQDVKALMSNVVTDAVDLSNDIVDTVQTVSHEVKEAKDTIQNNKYVQLISANVMALSPILKAADVMIGDLPEIGPIYNTGKNTFSTIKATYDTAMNFYKLYASEIPEEAALLVTEFVDNLEEIFAYLGWD